jgi:hypothetical protein
MGVSFVSLGHVAEALGWRITVKDGTATLDGEEAGVGGPSWSYTAAELRDLAALFTGAADLLDGGEKEQVENALTPEQIEALPVGAVVRDREGDEWTRHASTGRFQWGMGDTACALADELYAGYRPITLVSTPGDQQ